MYRLSFGQLRTLADFFNNLSLAWFTAGVIGPFFTEVEANYRILYTLFGLIFSYLFLNLALQVSQKLND
jgi:hypothetical protein